LGSRCSSIEKGGRSMCEPSLRHQMVCFECRINIFFVNSNSNLVLNGTSLTYRYYLENMLKLKGTDAYFNTGVLVMDLKKLRELDCFKTIADMIAGKQYYCFEQCIFNTLFKDKVHYLSMYWNVQNGYNVYGNFADFAGEKTKGSLKWSIPRYKIMHYVGLKKPWKYPDEPFAAPFLKYASKTPWFKNLIYAALADKAPEFLKKYGNI